MTKRQAPFTQECKWICVQTLWCCLRPVWTLLLQCVPLFACACCKELCVLCEWGLMTRTLPLCVHCWTHNQKEIFSYKNSVKFLFLRCAWNGQLCFRYPRVWFQYMPELLWWARLWWTKALLVLNPSWHSIHLNLRSFRWFALWFFRYVLVLNVLPQMSQWKFSVSIWLILWLAKLRLVGKQSPHSSHSKLRSRVWMVMWSCWLCLYENVLPQIPHANLFRFSCTVLTWRSR